MPHGIGTYKGKRNTYNGSWEYGKMHGSGHNQWLDEKNELIAEYLG